VPPAFPGTPERHSLVWIAAAARAEVVARDASERGVLTDWLACGRPLIARRRDPDLDAPGDIVPLGLPLPPAQDKRRIAAWAPSRAIACVAQPPNLADVLSHVPDPWGAALHSLRQRAAGLAIELRVYGSLAWQALTGLSYVTPRSDVDLLWRPASPAQLSGGIAMLYAWELETGLRADGEIAFRDGHAVSWREWSLPHADRVLARTLNEAALCERAQLAALLDG
jgi:phosphoribosyl-dephospho-CoA transferase